MSDKILIFGGLEGDIGWLAGRLYDFLPNSDVSYVDITDLKALTAELDRKKPDVVINAAGITGRPNIDWCEDHKLETVTGNVTGPLILLQACQERNIYWVHLSSGCIFQGSGPDGEGFKETDDDKATPPSFYSWTKYWADQALKNFPVLILRLRLPIDNQSNPRNLIDKLINYKWVIDNQNSITVIPDFLVVVSELIKKRRIEIYNVVNPGTISPAEIMRIYKEIVDPNHDFDPISEKEFCDLSLGKAARSNCKLNTDKLGKEGVPLKPIKERIVELMEEYKKNLKN